MKLEFTLCKYSELPTIKNLGSLYNPRSLEEGGGVKLKHTTVKI